MPTPTKTRMPARKRPSLNLNPTLLVGSLVLFLGLGLLVLGLYHAFQHGSCSTTGYSRYIGPIQHCAKGVGWWVGLTLLGIFLVLGGGAAVAGSTDTDSRSLGSVVSAVVAGAIGVGAAFGIAAGVNSAIGKVKAPASASVVSGSGVHTLSAAQVRANRVAICKDLVSGQRLLAAGVKTSLTSQCNADPAATQKRLTVEAKAAALSYAVKQCKQGVAAGTGGLPAATQALLSGQCGKAAYGGESSGGAATGTALGATEAAACQQIVKAQMPAAAQQAALAACRKP
jgi:hypothetical protein